MFENMSESGPAEAEINTLLEEVWEDFDKARNKVESSLSVNKDVVDEKLSQFLRKNSEYVSSGVERYLKMLS